MRDSNHVNEFGPQLILPGLRSCRDSMSQSEADRFGGGEHHFCDGNHCFSRECRRDYEQRLLDVGGLEFGDLASSEPVPELR